MNAENELCIEGYELEAALHRGATSMVYLANQVEPVERRVALKCLHAAVPTEWALRFERERQALASLEHEAIPRLFTTGCDANSRPWFAMEFVNGQPIIAAADRAALDLRARLKLFLGVCEAVQHAHQRGVLHRDLKPGNILVEDVEGVLRARVIDFGIARWQPAAESGNTVMRANAWIGSLAYAAPEQFRFTDADIDARCDVYSLGLILYELVSGVAARESGRLERLAAHELEDWILERDPPLPSRAATHRPQRRLLQGDLDAVVSRAIERDVEARYDSVGALAEDLSRFLRHEPVRARRVTLALRVRKFLRRRLLEVTLVAAVVAIAAMAGAVALRGLLERSASRERFELLAGVEKLRAALETQAELYPPRPAMAPALRDWLAHGAAPLLQLRDELPGVLASLRSLGEAASGSDRFLLQTLEELQDKLATFANPERGAVASVKSRLQLAEQTRRRSVDEHRADWRRVSRELAEDPRFRGIALEPQLDLIPIGRDPRSGLQEFAHLYSGDLPGRNSETGEIRLEEGSAMVFVLLPGGRFWLGAQSDDEGGSNYDPNARPYDSPLVESALDPFFLSKFETTQRQWERLSGRRAPCDYAIGETMPDDRRITGRHPVETISWDEADRWAQRTALVLPSDAQWEIAYRAGTETAYPWGASPACLEGVGNLNDATAAAAIRWSQPLEWADGHIIHAPIGLFAPNAFGLHDMAGNVEEWCRDIGDRTLPAPRPGDGLRPGAESREGRTVRGASFSQGAFAARAANSSRYARNGKRNNLGVRFARPVEVSSAESTASR